MQERNARNASEREEAAIPLGLILSRRAYRDLAEIWRYGAREWGSEQAFAYSDKINAAFDLLCERPGIGSARSRGALEYRRWVVGRHAILFQARGRYLHIIRILYVTRDERRYLS